MAALYLVSKVSEYQNSGISTLLVYTYNYIMRALPYTVKVLIL